MDLTAAIRTGVQALVALLLSVPFIADLGVAQQIEAILLAVATAVVTLILRWLETRFPWLAKIFSLGTSSSGPTYG